MEELKKVPTAWETRLVEERSDLLEKTLKLQTYMDNPETKLNRKEWDMLTRQLYTMKDYLQVLTERCAYYGLIESADLGLKYPNGTVRG